MTSSAMFIETTYVQLVSRGRDAVIALAAWNVAMDRHYLFSLWLTDECRSRPAGASPTICVCSRVGKMFTCRLRDSMAILEVSNTLPSYWREHGTRKKINFWFLTIKLSRNMSDMFRMYNLKQWKAKVAFFLLWNLYTEKYRILFSTTNLLNQWYHFFRAPTKFSKWINFQIWRISL